MDRTNHLTREEQCKIIEEKAGKWLLAELKYRRDDIDRDPPEEGEPAFDLLSAFDDFFDLVDTEDGFDKATRSQVRDIAIALNWYIPVSEEELANTVCTGRKYAFKHRNQKWVFNSKGDA